VEKGAKVAVAKASSREFPPADGFQEREIVGIAEAERAEAAAVVDHRPGDGVEDPRARSAIVDDGQSVEVALVGALGQSARRRRARSSLLVFGDLRSCTGRPSRFAAASAAVFTRWLVLNA